MARGGGIYTHTQMGSMAEFQNFVGCGRLIETGFNKEGRDPLVAAFSAKSFLRAGGEKYPTTASSSKVWCELLPNKVSLQVNCRDPPSLTGQRSLVEQN